MKRERGRTNSACYGEQGNKPASPARRVRAQPARHDLEQQVERRTAELAAANRELLAEVRQREQAVRELRGSEERFRVAFEEGPLGMVMIAPDGRFLHVNRAFCRMLDYTSEELHQKTVYDVTHPDEIDSTVALLSEVSAGRSPRGGGERRYVGKRGLLVSTRLTVSGVHSASGQMLYALAMMEDITEWKRAEEALRRAERLASVGVLAAGIAHEINNPLGAIVLSAEAALLARQAPNADEILQASLENIQTSAMRCGRIVKSVLQFARDEISQKWPASLAEVARHARDMTRKLAAERGVTVRLKLDDDAPQLVMNPTEMEQVLMNLISNAIQASNLGGEVVVGTSVAAGSLRVTVADCGQGMRKEEVAHMFDPFFSTRVSQGGTGLGLSITHGIVQDHGGVIEVHSEPGRGTTITLNFPIELCKAKGASHG